MTIALYTFIALLVLVVCIAVISIRSSQKRNRTTKLDKELFGEDDEDEQSLSVSAAKSLVRSMLQQYSEPKVVMKPIELNKELFEGHNEE